MKGNLNQISNILFLFRSYAQRFSFLFLITLSIIFIPISKLDPEISSKIRVVFVDSVSPILSFMSRPVYFTKSAIVEAKELINLRSELKKISAENNILYQWQDLGRKLEVENNALRKLLSVNEEPSSLVVTARVIADSGGFFVRTLILNAGTSQGVKKGYAVIGSNGLAGRIVEAGTRSSRVLQLSDMNSRIPVMISPYGQRGILVGDNTKRPSLLFLNNNIDNTLSLGDFVLTSGHGGLLPPGIKVGVVSSVEAGNIRVQPFMNSSKIEYVKVIKYMKK